MKEVPGGLLVLFVEKISFFPFCLLAVTVPALEDSHSEGDCGLRGKCAPSGTGPFRSGVLCFTGNGGFGHGTEFPSGEEADVSADNSASPSPLGDDGVWVTGCSLFLVLCFIALQRCVFHNLKTSPSTSREALYRDPGFRWWPGTVLRFGGDVNDFGR